MGNIDVLNMLLWVSGSYHRDIFGGGVVFMCIEICCLHLVFEALYVMYAMEERYRF